MAQNASDERIKRMMEVLDGSSESMNQNSLTKFSGQDQVLSSLSLELMNAQESPTNEEPETKAGSEVIPVSSE
jgi:hypothetical protein